MDLITKYFLITVMLKDNSVHKGIRKNEAGNVDSCFLLFRGKAEQTYGRDNIICFQCVQLSNHSDELKNHLMKSDSLGVRKRRHER